MYEVWIRRHLDAAHFLRGYGGKCEELHGHRFLVTVKVRAPKVDERGIAFDFSVLKKLLDEILREYDHSLLNEKEPFDKINPSSENLAFVIYRKMREKLPKEISISAVEVCESPDACAQFLPEELQR